MKKQENRRENLEELKDYGLAIEVEKIADAIDGIDEKISEPRNEYCSYCGEEETFEALDENKGLCDSCLEEALNNWKGAE